ncbi:MAG: GIY-YIG nuclease family protein [Firmicutes bacterium]|nr:GIY-YIG nuclease family protein [Bacillota bacterium]
MTFIILGAVFGTLLFCGIIFGLYIYFKRKMLRKTKTIEVRPENLQVLADFVQAQKDKSEQEQQLKELKRAEMKHKLETFKQTKDLLKDKLRCQLDNKEWKPLYEILRSADKGGVGIYVLHNITKDKYYAGQAKQLYKRVRDHFLVEDITKDFLRGDVINVKFLTANELDSDYRIDHIEKTGIEIYASDKSGYNKTTGNL